MTREICCARAVLFALGLIVAIPVGLITLTIGALVEPVARELMASLGVAGLNALLSDLAYGTPADLEGAGMLVGLWALSVLVLILPPPSLR